MHFQEHRWFRARTATVLLLVLAIGPFRAGVARAHTPDGEKVRGMISKAVAFLEQANDQGFGGNCLRALALIKSDEKKKSSQLVQDALNACQRNAANPLNVARGEKGVYELAVAIVFLCELDARLHQATIQPLLNELYQAQNGAGWWSYPARMIGDTSVTQYGMLALWSVDQANRRESELLFDVRPGAAERATNWLLRTQDPRGAWSYLGKDPGENNFNRIPQDTNVVINAGRITPSVSVGGLGSVYMGADVLRIEGHVEKKKRPEDAKSLLKKKKASAKAVDVTLPSHSMNIGVLRKAIDDGERYYTQECRTKTDHWQYYYLYGMERYHALRDLAIGNREAEPDWYNRGVDLLASEQKESGSWEGPIGDPAINTSFAMLFLLRSTEKTVAQTLAGRLRGDRGLPDDVSNLAESADGALLKPKELADVETIMARLGETEALDSLPTDVKFSEVPTQRKKQIAALAKLFSDSDHEKRVFAVRQVARAGDIGQVPALLYALTDPEARVVKEAHVGLRLISRKLSGFELPNEPTEAQKKEVQEKWKAWYKSVRPDADLDFLK